MFTKTRFSWTGICAHISSRGSEGLKGRMRGPVEEGKRGIGVPASGSFVSCVGSFRVLKSHLPHSADGAWGANFKIPF